jgi:hypothetical protein
MQRCSPQSETIPGKRQSFPHSRSPTIQSTDALTPKPVTTVFRRWGEMTAAVNQQTFADHFQDNPASRLRSIVYEDRVACSLFSQALNIR